MKPYSFAGCLLMLACATAPSTRTPDQPRPKAIYSTRESATLSYCDAIADTAFTVATHKKGGVSREEVVKRYAGTPRDQLAVATVNKVYEDDAQKPWEYAVALFKECATELAHVPADRSGMASFCQQNSMIARTAASYRDRGRPQDEAVAEFAAIKSKTPGEVVGRVFASKASAGEVTLAEFQACLAPFSE